MLQIFRFFFKLIPQSNKKISWRISVGFFCCSAKSCLAQQTVQLYYAKMNSLRCNTGHCTFVFIRMCVDYTQSSTRCVLQQIQRTMYQTAI